MDRTCSHTLTELSLHVFEVIEGWNRTFWREVLEQVMNGQFYWSGFESRRYTFLRLLEMERPAGPPSSCNRGMGYTQRIPKVRVSLTPGAQRSLVTGVAH